MAANALEGLRVLEYCRGLSGPFCTRLLADLGAEVLHVEPPGIGDDTRRMPPFAGDQPDPERSGLFLFLNANKLGVTLDPRLPAGADLFRRLAGTVDVVVEDWPPGHQETLGLGYDDLRPLNPGLVVASITPFGRSGPYAGYTAYGLNLTHASGQGYTLPMPSPHLERAPVQIGGHCADYDAGQAAAVAILAAIFARGVTGRGQFVEVSQLDALLALQRVENVARANGGEVITRHGPAADRGVSQMFECKDGFVVSVTPQDQQKQALAKLVGLDIEAQDTNSAVARDRVAAWMRGHTREEICARAQALSCPIAPVDSAADVARSPQMTDRGFFADVEHPKAGRVRLPARPYQFTQTPVGVRRPAPLLGEHNGLVYGERLGYAPSDLQALREDGVI